MFASVARLRTNTAMGLYSLKLPWKVVGGNTSHQQIGRKISGVFRAGRSYMVFCMVIRPYEVTPEREGPNVKPYEAIPENGAAYNAL